MRARVTRSFSFEAAPTCLHPAVPSLTATTTGWSHGGGSVGDHGVVIDFDDLRSVVEHEIVEPWDTTPHDMVDNPRPSSWPRSVERLEAVGLGTGLRLVGLRLWETPTPRSSVGE